MQHTSKYQFKLIEGTDDFSPAPLNQNAQKTETLLAGMEEDLAALEDSVDSQLAAVTAALGTGGSNARVTYGSYTGTGTYGSDNPITLNCPFKPLAVVI